MLADNIPTILFIFVSFLHNDSNRTTHTGPKHV